MNLKGMSLLSHHTAQTAWNAELYDSKIGFVSELGKGVLELLSPQEGEKILDLGCGTGDLTHAMAQAGAIPLGIDLSPEMIEKAQRKYPKVRFAVENGETFRSTTAFDAVFSNAALHWMVNPERVVETVWHALRPGGRFVAEFGGKDNVVRVLKGITDALAVYGIDATERNPWYFPSIGEYSAILEKQGFRVTYAVHFDRPTPLDGEDGLQHWLQAFAKPFVDDFSAEERERAFALMEEKLRPTLFQSGTWTVDYKRLRMVAVKPL